MNDNSNDAALVNAVVQASAASIVRKSLIELDKWNADTAAEWIRMTFDHPIWKAIFNKKGIGQH